MGDIYFELASITLSSCLLLAIKDNMDCERARSRTLKRQYAYYTRLKYTLYDSLDSLFASFGLPHMAWNTLSSKESAEGQKTSYRNGSAHPTSSDTIAVAIANSRILYEARSTIGNASYIDWGASEADDRAFDDALKALGQLEFASDNYDGSIFLSSVDMLIGSHLQILAGLRRPWNYPRDKARERLISKYLEAHAVKI